MRYSKMSLTQVVSLITSYTEVTVAEVMSLSMDEIKELAEAVANAEGAKLELHRKMKKLLDKPMPSVL